MKTFMIVYGQAFWKFRNEIKVKRVKDNEMKEKKVWKSKMTIKKHEEEEK